MRAILPLILLQTLNPKPLFFTPNFITGSRLDEDGAELVSMHQIDASSEDEQSSSSSRGEGGTVNTPPRIPHGPVRPPTQLEIDRMPR